MRKQFRQICHGRFNFTPVNHFSQRPPGCRNNRRAGSGHWSNRLIGRYQFEQFLLIPTLNHHAITTNGTDLSHIRYLIMQAIKHLPFRGQFLDNRKPAAFAS